MKKLPKFLITLLILSLLILPVISFAQGLVPCGTSTTGPCEAQGWNNLMTLINNVVSFILFKLAIPIAAIMFAYAGFELITSGGDVSKRDKAKKIFTNVAIGLIIAAAAWLIVNTILTTLGYDGSWIFGDKTTTTSTVTTSTTTTPTPTPSPTGGLIVVPTPTADDEVIYGKSLEEEGCENPDAPVSDNSNSPGFDLLKSLKLNKVFAQASPSEDLLNKQKIEKDFKEVRCWLSGWYTNRQLSDPELQKQYESSRVAINNRLMKLTYKIINGTYALSYYSGTGSVPEVTIIYDKKNFNEGEYTKSSFISIINKAIENDGKLIPIKEKLILNNLLPKSLVVGFFEDKWYLKERYSNFNKLLEYYYCVEVLGRDLSDPCYFATTKTIDGKEKTQINIAPNSNDNYSNLTSDLMAVRFNAWPWVISEEFDPTKDVTLEETLNILKEVTGWGGGFAFIYFSETMRGCPSADPYCQPSYDDYPLFFFNLNLGVDEHEINRVLLSLTFPILGDMIDCTGNHNECPTQLICSFKTRTNKALGLKPEEQIFSYPLCSPPATLQQSFDRGEEFDTFMDNLMGVKLQTLFNSTL